MKNQILILISLTIVAIGFFLLINNSSSNSGTLFEAETEILRADGIGYEDEDMVVRVETEEKIPNQHGMVFVDVQGEVVNPGVFEVDHDVRVGYLITLAGGVTDDANMRGLNQAARIYDEMVIFVPHIDDVQELAIGTDVSDENSSGVDESGLISLSTASALELQSLPGIGPTLSANIIARREMNGAFLSIDELINVDGIGAGTVENIREFVKP